MAFLADADLKEALRQMLKLTAASEMEEPLSAMVPDANEAAQNEIEAALAARGYSASQAAAWDRAEEYNRDLGLWWLLVKGAGLNRFDETFVSKLDRRKELSNAAILISGVIQTPELAGQVEHAALSTSADIFSLDVVW